MSEDVAKRKWTLNTFRYEEGPIFHVENSLNAQGFDVPRNELRQLLSSLLKQGILRIFDKSLEEQITFENSNAEYIEDFWFKLTDRGISELGINGTDAKFLLD